MSIQYTLIYFIHDDAGTEFEDILCSNILKAKIPSTIKAYLIYNKRIVTGSDVFYKTVVSEIVTTETSSTVPKRLSCFDVWQNAIRFVFDELDKLDTPEQLGKPRLREKVGLITLSHAGGFVINLSGAISELIFNNKNKNLVVKLKSKRRVDNNRYIVRPINKESAFICTKTITNLSTKKDTGKSNTIKKDSSKIAFRRQYIRKSNIEYCRNYEGLFTHELSNFFETAKIKFKFIIFSNCNIQVYDNGYLFAPVADFTIGAETNSNMSTWDFPTIIQAINTHANAQPFELVNAIFNSCLQNFITQDLTYRYFLTQTAQFSSLHIIFEDILKIILEEIKYNATYKTKLLDWVEWERATNDNVPLFDTMIFFNAANRFSDKKFDALLNAFDQLLQKNIVIGRSSDDPLYCGYSLYIPRTKQQFASIKGGICNYFNKILPNPFTSNSAYDDLLSQLFE